MGLATAYTLRCPLVTLASRTATLLRRWLLARSGRVTTRLHALPHKFALVLEVFERLVHEVATQWLIEILLVEGDNLVGEAPGDKVVDGDLHV